MRYSAEVQLATLWAMPGGDDLIRRCGGDPLFHDAELLSLRLAVNKPCSALDVLWWPALCDGHPADHFVAAFDIEEVIDLELTGFYTQNSLNDLLFYPAPDRPERAQYAAPSNGSDIEIAINPHVGLGGWIRCRGVTIKTESISVHDVAT